MRWITPYTFGARFYDWFSGEKLLYRAGRVAGIPLLHLQRGDVVLDVGCGTGLNFPLLSDAVGPDGLVIGLDSSPQMLRVAQRRIERSNLNNVRLLEADAVAFPPSIVAEVLTDAGRGPGVDALFASYALSVTTDWRAAWSNGLAVLRSDARVGVVDMQPPTGRASLLAPLARLACWMGGADIRARPWTAVETSCVDVEQVLVRGGHIVATAGTLRSQCSEASAGPRR
ncbi:MAG: methyltransferase domain-containing protein [Arachnia sp.]